MTFQRTARRAVAVGAAVALAAAGLTVLSSPAFAAGATIQINTLGNIGTGQTISVSGNAGAANAPDLYVAVCESTPTASNCDQSLSGFGTPTAHIQQVTPDPTTGAWSTSFFVRTTIVTGHTPTPGFNCLTTATCVIGTTDSADPTNHTYDSTAPLSPRLGPNVTLSSSTGVNGDVITVTGTGYPAATTPNSGTSTPLNTALNVGLCGFPPSASNCDGTLAHYPVVNVDASGHFTTPLTLNFPFTDFASVSHSCTAANSCIVGTSNQANNADQTNTAGALIRNVPGASLAIASVTGQTGTTAARSGNAINVTGANWDPSGAITAKLCNTGGANCDATGITNNTLATDGSGNLTGGAVVDASATTGSRSLVISQGTHVKSAPITILGTPTLAGNPAGGGAGTAVTLNGSNWNPGSTVTLQGMAGAGASADPATTVTASATGSISGSYTVNDPATTAIQASSGTLTASQAFSTSALSCNVPAGGSCALTQNIHFLANPGQLQQSLAGGDVDLGAITLTGKDQSINGSIKTDTVTDARGSSAGWALTAKLSDFTNGGTPTTHGTIPAANLAWTPSCAVTSGGATPVAGSSTALSNTDQSFCSVPSGTGNGVYTADAALTLTVPATADAGTYNAILTLTLS